MLRRQVFLSARFSERWQKSYPSLPSEKQAACDRVVIFLIKRQETAGMRVKPILPEKHFQEARISEGDRIVFRVEGGVLFFENIVKHDEIGRYGRRPPTIR